jgi:hypothetical protein
MRPIAIAVSTTAARCKRFAGSQGLPETLVKHNDQLESEQAWMPGRTMRALPGLARSLSRATRFFLCRHPEARLPIRAASTATLTALHLNWMESAHTSGILGATRLLSAVRVLSIGASTPSWLSALVKRQ